MTFFDFLFWSVGLLTCVGAVGVVVTQNIVRAAVWLLLTLGGSAGLFFLLGFDFVGATQLLVYVGGILILLVFGVMLTAKGPFVNLKTAAGEWAIGLTVGSLLFGLMSVVILVTDWSTGPMAPPQDVASSRYSNDLGGAFLGFTRFTAEAPLPIQPDADGTVQQRKRIRMGYLLPFEIVSVHLLVVLIGAAYLARAKRRREGAAS